LLLRGRVVDVLGVGAAHCVGVASLASFLLWVVLVRARRVGVWYVLLSLYLPPIPPIPPVAPLFSMNEECLTLFYFLIDRRLDH
jgi:hypothetical protein